MNAGVPHARERIDLLITTDVVSEGLNLQDAGAIVHLDLPWTTARLAQRVGRVARAGSPHAEVHSYSFAPPRAAAALLDLEARLARKRRIAAELVGGDQRVAALVGGTSEPGDGAAVARSRILELLRPWRAASAAPDPVVCGVAAPASGWLALVVDRETPRLVARIEHGEPSTDPRVVADVVAWLVHNEEHWLPASWESVHDEVLVWIAAERGRILSGAHKPHASRERQRVLASTMSALAAAPPHERARAAASEDAKLSPSGMRNGGTGMLLRALVVFCTHGEREKPGGTAV
jgi:hypothetical protein